VLRFGSTSELRQHLTADHRPARPHLPPKLEHPQPISTGNDLPLRTPQTPAVPEQHPARASGLSVLIAMVLVTLIAAALSWRVAVVLTIPLFAAVLFYNDRHRSENRH
jgi:hypothetical protein